MEIRVERETFLKGLSRVLGVVERKSTMPILSNTLLAVTGLTHRQAYKDIFAITAIKTLAVFVVIGVFYATGIV